MKQAKTETIVFGGGCFWCTEAVFYELKGIVSVKPGYAGGTTPNPTYNQVSTGRTGHAEVIEITYDPSVIVFHDLLTVFFAVHDPTTLNRQGADIGTQYRSIILYTTENQKREAESYIQEINTSNTAGGSVVTEVKPLELFYPAESYHEQYYARNQSEPYSQVVISPKLEKLQKDFERLFRPFFTTKPVGKALGLGLYSAHAIIERHRGQINAFSQPGVATTFEVILPLDNPRDL